MYEGTGLGSPMIYVILRILVLAVFFIAGYGISYGKEENFKKYAWFAGIVYCLVEGLRWMRGADYCHYYNDIVTNLGQNPINLYGSRQVTPDPELLYEAWINIFNFTTLPFWVAFIFYSAIFILGFLLIIKHFRSAAVIALPLFFIITVDFSENIIRQCFATSLICLAYYFWLIDKRKWMLVLLICAPLLHYSAVVIDAVFLFVAYTWKPGEKVYRSYALLGALVALFLYCFFLFDIENFQFLADFALENVDMGDDKAATYIDDADQWLTEDGSLSMINFGTSLGAISLYNQIVKFISYMIIIVIGFVATRNDKRLAIAYACSYLAIIMKTICGDIELYLRMYYWFVVFLPIVAGAAFAQKWIKPLGKAAIVLVFILFFLWYSFLSSGVTSTLFGYGFIWDANVNLW